MGFERDIRTIIQMVRPDRQTVMFSATWPAEIRSLAAEFQLAPVKVTIGSDDLTANHNVTQIVEVLDPYAKDQRLKDLLKKYHSGNNHNNNNIKII